MKLTRAAFAVMIKFAGLMNTFQNVLDQVEEDKETGVIPNEIGPQRDN